MRPRIRPCLLLLQIAAVFEFVGAVSLGGSVTSTVKGAITNPLAFQEEPQVCKSCFPLTAFGFLHRLAPSAQL